MCAQRRKISLGITPGEFYEGEHICLIYNDDKERLATIAKFFISGLEAGERIFYAETMPRKTFMEAMTQYGLDISSFEHDFSLAEAYPTFCPEGQFTASNVFNNMANFYQIAVDEGYTGARGGAEMTWASVEGSVEIDKLMELEARRNQVLKKHPFSTCCLYDARKFEGATIMDVLHTHPAVIVKGQLVRNPYYVEPETFLKQLRERRGGGNDRGDEP